MRDRTRRSLRLLAGFMVVGTVLFLAVSGLTAWRTGTYDRNIQRLPDALPNGSTVRPRPVEDPGQNWLLIGSDLRGVPTEEKWRPGRAHADTIMLLHLPEEGRRAYVLSVPRDLWVDIPGRSKGKVTEALSHGGPALLAETVESISGVRLDHVAAVDFDGFEKMTDALGGVEVRLKAPVYDPSNGWSWPAGVNKLDGEEALRFVRERKGLSGSDLDRVKRQHAFLRAMAGKAASTGTLTNPFKLDAFLRAASESLAVDSETEFGTLRALAMRLARIGPERLTFVTVPTGSSAWIGDQNVLLQSEERADGLFDALLDGDLPEYLERHGLENEVGRVN